MTGRSFRRLVSIKRLYLLLLAPDMSHAFAPNTNPSNIFHQGHNNHHHQQQQQQLTDKALYQSSFSREPPSSSSSSSSNGSSPASSSVDAMRNDIEAMRREAQRRLDALTMDLQEFQKSKSAYKTNDSKENLPLATSLDSSVERDLTKAASYMPKTTPETLRDEDKGVEQIVADAPVTTSTTANLALEISNRPVNVHLLEHTRWKIVFNLGREPRTWMSPTWGASGDRLRFTVEVDLLDEPLQDREDFLEGMAGAKKLRVREAWLGPTFDDSYHGRRELRVAPMGGYKVVRGAGPLGTDVFRFYIEVEESFRAAAGSDTYCPSGRVYGNCGYFQTLDPDTRDAFHAYKDRLQKDYRAAATKYERLQQEDEEDSNLISWGKFSRIQDEMKLRKLLQDLDSKIQEARQREPEKSQLRLSRKGDVGLTREGGVCCKVQKGLALEYHILGRQEIAAVETEHGNIHEGYGDLVEKLHP